LKKLKEDNMSVVVSYPVEIKQYQASVQREMAAIFLEGVELGETGPSDEVRRVGVIVFGHPHPVSDEDFITRGGFLRMDRPLAMFAGVLALLRHQKPLFLQGDGTLSDSPQARFAIPSDPIGS